MKKRISLTNVYVLIFGALSLIFLIIIINLFNIAINIFSASNVSRSPLYISPSLISLSTSFLIIIVGGWIILFNLLTSTTKAMDY